MSEYSKAMSDMLDREPMRSVIEALSTMTEAVMNQTGRHGIKRVVIDREWALSLGLLPGQAMKIATASGEVEISSEMTPTDIERHCADAICAEIDRVMQGAPPVGGGR